MKIIAETGELNRSVVKELPFWAFRYGALFHSFNLEISCFSVTNKKKASCPALNVFTTE
jgi:hypothetical protein